MNERTSRLVAYYVFPHFVSICMQCFNDVVINLISLSHDTLANDISLDSL